MEYHICYRSTDSFELSLPIQVATTLGSDLDIVGGRFSCQYISISKLTNTGSPRALERGSAGICSDYAVIDIIRLGLDFGCQGLDRCPTRGSYLFLLHSRF